MDAASSDNMFFTGIVSIARTTVTICFVSDF